MDEHEQRLEKMRQLIPLVESKVAVMLDLLRAGFITTPDDAAAEKAAEHLLKVLAETPLRGS